MVKEIGQAFKTKKGPEARILEYLRALGKLAFCISSRSWFSFPSSAWERGYKRSLGTRIRIDRIGDR
jgi:hypothetical protein